MWLANAAKNGYSKPLYEKDSFFSNCWESISPLLKQSDILQGKYEGTAVRV